VLTVFGKNLENSGVVCVSLRVWGRGWYQIRIRGVGVAGGGAGNFTYAHSIRYNIIMRCKPVSYNPDLKGHHEKEIPHEIH